MNSRAIVIVVSQSLKDLWSKTETIGVIVVGMCCPLVFDTIVNQSNPSLVACATSATGMIVGIVATSGVCYFLFRGKPIQKCATYDIRFCGIRKWGGYFYTLRPLL